MKTTVLIAVHNRLAFTQRCVESLRVASREKAVRYVVVDDGSTDGTAEWLAGQPDIETLRGNGDLWFGGATDLGIRFIIDNHGECTHLLIINNDTFVRPGALDSIFEAAGGDERAVVAAAFWVEDRQCANSAGFRWLPWHGLTDACTLDEWRARHRIVDKNRRDLPVDAVATTVTLFPMILLRKIMLPSLRLHPHHRYDAVLSARLRSAGAHFICTTDLLADHIYGPVTHRATVRNMRVGRYLHESFRDPLSVWYLAGGLALSWESAPDRLQACWAIAMRLGQFLRQLAWVSFNSVRCRSLLSKPDPKAA